VAVRRLSHTVARDGDGIIPSAVDAFTDVSFYVLFAFRKQLACSMGKTRWLTMEAFRAKQNAFLQFEDRQRRKLKQKQRSLTSKSLLSLPEYIMSPYQVRNTAGQDRFRQFAEEMIGDATAVRFD
jgi:hypothetical protein